MKQLVSILTVLSLCSLGITQDVSQRSLGPGRASTSTPHAISQVSPSSTTCSQTFASGSKNTYLFYCVSPNGNVFYVQTPAGHIHSSVYEGYGLCDANVPTVYYDYGEGGDSGNWHASGLFSSSPTSMKIARNTGDDLWTLTQTITQLASTSSVKISMSLRNNSTVSKTVYLVRYNYVSPDGVVFANYDSTQNSAFAWNSAPNPSALMPSFGLVLQNVGNPQLPAWGGVAQSTASGPNPCAFAFNWTGGVATNINGSLVMAYVGSIPPLATKTVSVIYKGM